jgi:hypothetical protein
MQMAVYLQVTNALLFCDDLEFITQMLQGYGKIIHDHNTNRAVTVSVGLNVLWDCLLQPDLINIFHNRINKIYSPAHS